MKYEIHQRVRYSEIDELKQLTLPAIINYFQDCSTFQSEELGVGVSYLADKQRAWILLGWQIVVKRRPSFGEEIVVQTWATDFNQIYGNRNFQIESKSGESLVRANSIWVCMDTQRGRPCKADIKDIECYGTVKALKMETVSRKIERPDEWEVLAEFPVRHYHIDTNGHVNNSQYIQMAGEFLPVHYETEQLRVEYKKAAIFGDVIIPRIAREDERVVVELCDKDGKAFAIVEYRRR